MSDKTPKFLHILTGSNPLEQDLDYNANMNKMIGRFVILAMKHHGNPLRFSASVAAAETELDDYAIRISVERPKNT